MKKICILYGAYDQDEIGSMFMSSVTDWVEVSDDDFDALRRAQRERFYDQRFTIVEQPMSQEVFVREAIEQGRKLLETEKSKIEAEKRRRREAADRKAAKSLERELKTLEQLAKKHPDVVKDITRHDLA